MPTLSSRLYSYRHHFKSSRVWHTRTTAFLFTELTVQKNQTCYFMIQNYLIIHQTTMSAL